jgi:hypothetical protein
LRSCPGVFRRTGSRGRHDTFGATVDPVKRFRDHPSPDLDFEMVKPLVIGSKHLDRVEAPDVISDSMTICCDVQLCLPERLSNRTAAPHLGGTKTHDPRSRWKMRMKASKQDTYLGVLTSIRISGQRASEIHLGPEPRDSVAIAGDETTPTSSRLCPSGVCIRVSPQACLASLSGLSVCPLSVILVRS